MTWDDLSRVEQIRELADEDRVVLNEIRAVLQRHGALERFGVMLLHSHFDLAPDKVLVEEVDSDSRTLTITPRQVPTDGDTPSLTATSFRLDRGIAPMTVTYCYRPPNSQFHAR